MEYARKFLQLAPGQRDRQVRKLNFATTMELNSNLYRIRIGHPTLLLIDDMQLHYKQQEKAAVRRGLEAYCYKKYGTFQRD
jgi:hypothetical protein